MKFFSHKDVWNIDSLVEEYDIRDPQLSWPEYDLTARSKNFLKDSAQNILCVGCGGGRDRKAGRKDQKYFAHYYTRTELHGLLEEAGFKQIQITSLAEFYNSKPRKYNRLTGYNNLMFFAVKE